MRLRAALRDGGDTVSSEELTRKAPSDKGLPQPIAWRAGYSYASSCPRSPIYGVGSSKRLARDAAVGSCRKSQN